MGSYGLALWAMTQAPLAVVAALRETSILFGALLAFLMLKEKVAGLRIVALWHRWRVLRLLPCPDQLATKLPQIVYKSCLAAVILPPRICPSHLLW
jgi:hypothetical protein